MYVQFKCLDSKWALDPSLVGLGVLLGQEVGANNFSSKQLMSCVYLCAGYSEIRHFYSKKIIKRINKTKQYNSIQYNTKQVSCKQMRSKTNTHIIRIIYNKSRIMTKKTLITKQTICMEIVSFVVCRRHIYYTHIIHCNNNNIICTMESN